MGVEMLLRHMTKSRVRTREKKTIPSPELFGLKKRLTCFVIDMLTTLVLEKSVE